MKKLISTAVLTVVTSFNFANAGALEEQIEKKIRPVLDTIPVEKITRSEKLGLYEVITPRGIFYTDKKGSFVLFGATAVDTTTKANLTAARMEQLGEFEFNKLPLSDAIKIVHGKGTRKIVTFEDPNCGFCKKLSHELQKVDDVTIYTFLYPILSADSTDKSKAAWCAQDPARSYEEFMLRGTPLPENKDCANPIAKNTALGQKLRVMGTPAIMFENNTRAPGFITAEAIEARLKNE